MAADELTRPLGLKPARSRYPVMRILAIAAPPAVLAIAAAVYLLLPPGQPAPDGKAVAGAAADRTGSIPAHPSPPMASDGPGLVELTPDDGGLAPVGGDVVITDPNSPPAVQPRRGAARRPRREDPRRAPAEDRR